MWYLRWCCTDQLFLAICWFSLPVTATLGSYWSVQADGMLTQHNMKQSRKTIETLVLHYSYSGMKTAFSLSLTHEFSPSQFITLYFQHTPYVALCVCVCCKDLIPTVQVRVLKCVAVSIQHQNCIEISFNEILAQRKTVLLLSISN